MKRTPKILILGGGFAGVDVAGSSRNTLLRMSRYSNWSSRDNFVLFTPMLHEIAASDLDISTKAPHGSECIRQHPFGSIQASP